MDPLPKSEGDATASRKARCQILLTVLIDLFLVPLLPLEVQPAATQDAEKEAYDRFDMIHRAVPLVMLHLETDRH